MIAVFLRNFPPMGDRPGMARAEASYQVDFLGSRVPCYLRSLGHGHLYSRWEPIVSGGYRVIIPVPLGDCAEMAILDRRWEPIVSGGYRVFLPLPLGEYAVMAIPSAGYYGNFQADRVPSTTRLWAIGLQFFT